MRKHWRHQVDSAKFDHLLNAAIPFLIILGIMTNEILLLSIAFFFAFIILLNKWYLSYVKKQIHVINHSQTKRLFPNDESELVIPFENVGKIPIISGKWWFNLYDSDESIKVMNNRQFEENNFTYQQAFSLPPLTKREFLIPIRAQKRGIAQVRSIEVVIYDLFKINAVRMQYEGPFREEAIVYPSFTVVDSLAKVIQNERGYQPQHFSLHEETMLTRGTREYVSSDPFNRINWKASARTDQLQTKVYEKVTISRWTFVVNIRDENPLQPTLLQLEKVLSQVAFACQFATKNNIHYDLYVNLRIPNSTIGLYLPAGHGKRHLMRALEILSRIRKANMTTPIDKALSSIVSDPGHYSVLFHFGTFGEEEGSYYSLAKQLGLQIHRIPFFETDDNLQDSGGDRHEALAN
ncbi:DUF58 domain-containing protein [Evansella halocellulosilytica]|uniref:DUF58 domain-containing protein n=1 Tax=Evansella halocellulosilytica TaxID=2011013 RepID=UPI000BB75619|nr:DUF58 domain-containing protein [Evansella halocellulosilytica]